MDSYPGSPSHAEQFLTVLRLSPQGIPKGRAPGAQNGCLFLVPSMDGLPLLPCVTLPSLIPASRGHSPDTLLTHIPEIWGLSIGELKRGQ